jgi:tRNA (Thr-GGU) A37 N-methylase
LGHGDKQSHTPLYRPKNSAGSAVGSSCRAIGLTDIEGCSPLIVLWAFDRSDGFDWMVTPPSDTRVRGVDMLDGCYRINYLQGFENIGGWVGVLIKW